MCYEISDDTAAYKAALVFHVPSAPSPLCAFAPPRLRPSAPSPLHAFGKIVCTVWFEQTTCRRGWNTQTNSGKSLDEHTISWDYLFIN